MPQLLSIFLVALAMSTLVLLSMLTTGDNALPNIYQYLHSVLLVTLVLDTVNTIMLFEYRYYLSVTLFYGAINPIRIGQYYLEALIVERRVQGVDFADRSRVLWDGLFAVEILAPLLAVGDSAPDLEMSSVYASGQGNQRGSTAALPAAARSSGSALTRRQSRFDMINPLHSLAISAALSAVSTDDDGTTGAGGAALRPNPASDTVAGGGDDGGGEVGLGLGGSDATAPSLQRRTGHASSLAPSTPLKESVKLRPVSRGEFLSSHDQGMESVELKHIEPNQYVPQSSQALSVQLRPVSQVMSAPEDSSGRAKEGSSGRGQLKQSLLGKRRSFLEKLVFFEDSAGNTRYVLNDLVSRTNPLHMPTRATARPGSVGNNGASSSVSSTGDVETAEVLEVQSEIQFDTL